MSAQLDVAVVGGGPAGLALAIALRRAGVGVGVLEQRTGPGAHLSEQVPGALRGPLTQLGLWDGFRRQRHLTCSGAASLWTGATLAVSDGIRTPLGAGWHLDRAAFERLLRERARDAGAAVELGTRVVSLSRRAGRWWAQCARGSAATRYAISARVVVDATGRRATVARWLGIRRRQFDRLICLSAEFVGMDPPRRTLVEAVPEGWWYAAPARAGRAVAALFSDVRGVRDGRLRERASWSAALARTVAVNGFVGGPPAPRRLAIAVATPHLLDVAAGAGWLAVGDAACSFDPLAAAGVAHALNGAAPAADAIARYLAGDPDALLRRATGPHRRYARYEWERRELYELANRWADAGGFWSRRRES